PSAAPHRTQNQPLIAVTLPPGPVWGPEVLKISAQEPRPPDRRDRPRPSPRQGGELPFWRLASFRHRPADRPLNATPAVGFVSKPDLWPEPLPFWRLTLYVRRHAAGAARA